MSWLKFSFTLFLLAFSSLALADFCNFAKVEAVHGSATVLREGISSDVIPNLAVCKGDQYLTNKNSVIQFIRKSH